MTVRLWWLWAVATALGVVLIVLPDVGPRVFSFSATHGPTVIELAGIVLLLAGEAALLRGLWRGRRALLGRPTALRVGAALAVAAAALTAWSILGDRAQWWMLGVAAFGRSTACRRGGDHPAELDALA